MNQLKIMAKAAANSCHETRYCPIDSSCPFSNSSCDEITDRDWIYYFESERSPKKSICTKHKNRLKEILIADRRDLESISDILIKDKIWKLDKYKEEYQAIRYSSQAIQNSIFKLLFLSGWNSYSDERAKMQFLCIKRKVSAFVDLFYGLIPLDHVNAEIRKIKKRLNRSIDI